MSRDKHAGRFQSEDPPEPFDRWTWKNLSGENPRRRFTDDQLLDVFDNCRSRRNESRFAKLHGMSVAYVRSIRLQGGKLPIVQRALLRRILKDRQQQSEEPGS